MEPILEEAQENIANYAAYFGITLAALSLENTSEDFEPFTAEQVQVATWAALTSHAVNQSYPPDLDLTEAILTSLEAFTQSVQANFIYATQGAADATLSAEELGESADV